MNAFSHDKKTIHNRCMLDFYSQIEANDRRLIETTLDEASNENYTEDASMVFA